MTLSKCELLSIDLGYLDDEEMARQLVELGYRGLGDTIRREDFHARYLSIYQYINL
jgi:hypothetical protein